MQSFDTAAETVVSRSQNAHSTVTLVAATISLIWYLVVVNVCIVGFVQIHRYWSHPAPPAQLEDEPDVTVIRPVKGLEPCLYECLACTFRQVYAKQKLHIRFCVSSRNDPGMPILEQLLRDFPDFDAQILIEHEDELLQNGPLKLGPNPKIRNMSRAFREAVGDIIWIIDCNVWVGKHTCGRMVENLASHKFVHLLPLAIDITPAQPQTSWSMLGGRLEEMFLSSAHGKFYVSINTVSVAPACIGKSTMFRRSHLDSLTDYQGIDYFSYNICEDHLIGDLLWKQKVPEERGEHGTRLGKHALCFGDLAIQPFSGVPIGEYWNRRIRWVRVRKFTVLLATLVEPGTESFTCSLFGAFAITTLPVFHNWLGIPQTWTAFFAVYLLSVSIWCALDWPLYKLLHSGASIHLDAQTPLFAQTQSSRMSKTFLEWLPAWLGREAIALPSWLWAFWGGMTVEWRGKKFWVGMDTKVYVIPTISRKNEDTSGDRGYVQNGSRNGLMNGKNKDRPD